jgi:hypothetical protein
MARSTIDWRSQSMCDLFVVICLLSSADDKGERCLHSLRLKAFGDLRAAEPRLTDPRGRHMTRQSAAIPPLFSKLLVEQPLVSQTWPRDAVAAFAAPGSTSRWGRHQRLCPTCGQSHRSAVLIASKCFKSPSGWFRTWRSALRPTHEKRWPL